MLETGMESILPSEVHQVRVRKDSLQREVTQFPIQGLHQHRQRRAVRALGSPAETLDDSPCEQRESRENRGQYQYSRHGFNTFSSVRFKPSSFSAKTTSVWTPAADKTRSPA